MSKRNREFEAPEVISAFTAPSSVSSPGPPGTRERRHPRAGRRAAADHAEPPAGGRSINLVFAMLGVIIVGMVVVTLVRMRRETLEARRRRGREQQLVTPPPVPRHDPPSPPALRE